MNNNFGQHTHYNNNFINGYQRHINSNTPFANNPMLTSNPIFHGSIQDANFQTRANFAKLEQRKKVKTVNDLGMSRDQILNYVIDPIKVVKQSKDEFQQLYDEKSNTYINPSDLNHITRHDQSKLPKWLKEIYAGRKNTPYKSILKSANILKQEHYDKKFSNEDELLIHKVTAFDSDIIQFIQELATKLEMFEEHDGEIKQIYSLSKEAQHKKDFEYVQKYKHRSGYDPEDYTDLKKYYKKEQKRINKENKRIDEMIEMFLISGQVSKEVFENLQQTMEEDVDDKEIEDVFKKSEKELEKKLEKELRKELGDEEFDTIMEQLGVNTKEENSEEENNEEEHSEEEIVTKTKRVTIKQKIPEKKSKVKITVKNIEEQQESKQIGQIDSSDLEKYKNRKKK